MLPFRPSSALTLAFVVVAGVLVGCPPAPRDELPTQAPAILIVPTATVTPEPEEPPPPAAPAFTDKSEDMVSNLGGFDPVLIDAPNDQKGKVASTDLLSAHAVIDKERMYVRLAFREEMPTIAPAELRFWLEQGEPLVTVEVKLGSKGRPCELSAIATPDEQQVVESCFYSGNPIDLSFPLSAIPKVIDVTQPFHASGFQTCCMDEARNDPFDEIQNAQEVFRVGWGATGDAGG